MARALLAWLLILMGAVVVAIAHFLGVVDVPGLPDFSPAAPSAAVAVASGPSGAPGGTAATPPAAAPQPAAPGNAGGWPSASQTPAAPPPTAPPAPAQAGGQVAPRDPAWAQVAPDAQRHPKLGLPDHVVDRRTGIEMVLVEEGEYTRGVDPYGRRNLPPDVTPAHLVVISRPFYIGVHEVTYGQWRKVLPVPRRRNQPPGDDFPIENIFLTDIEEFLGRTQLRLPTDAEWEFACKAGREDPIFGNVEDPGAPSLATMADFAWMKTNSGGGTHSVGRKKPNGNRVFDMLGNVSEWTSSWYYKADYEEAAPRAVDPKGPQYGEHKVIRGCNHASDPQRCSCALRSHGDVRRLDNMIGSDRNLGFRVARDAD